MSVPKRLWKSPTTTNKSAYAYSAGVILFALVVFSIFQIS